MANKILSNPFNATNLGNGSLNAVIGAAGNAVGSSIGGGMTSTAGNIMGGLSKIAGAIPGPWGAIASTGLGVLGGVTNRLWGSKLNQENIAEVEGNINKANSFQSDANSFDTLASTWGEASHVSNFTDKYIGTDGVWSNKAKTLANKLRTQANIANAFIDNTLLNNADNLEQQQLNTLEANYAAFGGDLNTNGGIFPTGLNYIDTGGTHEENPYGGIPMGIDSNGTPNLVEEGEVIYNNYVFSNRLKVPKAVQSKYKLRGKKNLTFADAAKQINKYNEERPNDSISKATTNELLSSMIVEQENVKENMRNKNNKYAYGGKVNKFAGTDPNASSSMDINPYAGMSNWNIEGGGMAGVPLNNRYKDWSDFRLSDGTPLRIGDAYIGGYMSSAFKDYANKIYSGNDRDKYFNPTTMPNFFAKNKNLGTWNEAWNLSHDNNYGDYHKAMAALYQDYLDTNKFSQTPTIPQPKEVTDNINNNNIDSSNKDKDELDLGTSPEWLRYAPAVGLGITSITDALGLTNKPNYEAASRIEAAVGNNGYKPVEWERLGNKLKYEAQDRDYYLNQLNASTGATRRAITNNSNGNRGAAIAGLLAQDYNTNNAIGNAFMQMNKENFARKAQVEDFNRATNQANSQGMLQADMANQQAYNSVRDFSLRGTMAAAEMRQKARLAAEQAKSTNLSGFLQALGDIGYENKGMDMIRRLAETGALGAISKGHPLYKYLNTDAGKESKSKKSLTRG